MMQQNDDRVSTRRCSQRAMMVLFITVLAVSSSLLLRRRNRRGRENTAPSLSPSSPFSPTVGFKNRTTTLLIDDVSTFMGGEIGLDELDVSTGCVPLECMSSHVFKNTRDRLGHDAPIYKGQALCNSDKERYPDAFFQFGLTPSGALVWQNCSTANPADDSLVVVLHHAGVDDPDVPSLPSENLWFQMTQNATWQIRATSSSAGADSDTPDVAVIWQHAVQNQPTPIEKHPRCLNNDPVLDCPYIHFRRHGDVIMNFIASGSWVACKSRKICYPDLFLAS